MNDVISIAYFGIDVGQDATSSNKSKNNITNDEACDVLYEEIDDDEYIPMTNEEIDAMFE